MVTARARPLSAGCSTAPAPKRFRGALASLLGGVGPGGSEPPQQVDAAEATKQPVGHMLDTLGDTFFGEQSSSSAAPASSKPGEIPLIDDSDDDSEGGQPAAGAKAPATPIDDRRIVGQAPAQMVKQDGSDNDSDSEEDPPQDGQQSDASEAPFPAEPESCSDSDSDDGQVGYDRPELLRRMAEKQAKQIAAAAVTILTCVFCTIRSKDLICKVV